MIRCLAIAAVLLLVGSVTEPVSAQGGPKCAARDVILEFLAERYGEEPIGIGTTSTGSLIEVVASKDGLTWSILLSMNSGITCMLAAGEGWRWLPMRLRGPRL